MVLPGCSLRPSSQLWEGLAPPCGAHGAAWSHPHCPACMATGTKGAARDVLPGQRCPFGPQGESLLFLGLWWLLLVGRRPSSRFPRARRRVEVNGKLGSGTDVCSSQTLLPAALGTGPLQHMRGPPSPWGVVTRWEQQKVSCPGPHPLLLCAAEGHLQSCSSPACPLITPSCPCNGDGAGMGAREAGAVCSWV